MFCHPYPSDPIFHPEYGWDIDWLTVHNDRFDYILNGRWDLYAHPAPEKLYDTIDKDNKDNKEYAKSQVFVKLKHEIYNLEIKKPVTKIEIKKLNEDVIKRIYSNFYKIGEKYYDIDEEKEEFLGTYVKTTTSSIDNYEQSLYYTHIFKNNNIENILFSPYNQLSHLTQGNCCGRQGCTMFGGKKYKSKKRKNYKKTRSKKNKKNYKKTRSKKISKSLQRCK
jgi:hypothetical protein